MLNAIGLANVGLDRFIEEKLPIIAKMSVPVFVNVAGELIDEYVAVVERLAREKAIAGFELNISCPNVAKGGISFGRDPVPGQRDHRRPFAKPPATRLLIVKLSPCVTDISVIARAAVEAGADALSLINTFTAMVIDIETRRPVLANRTGGLSGPAIKPIAVYLVNKVYNEVAKKAGIPDPRPGRHPHGLGRHRVPHRRRLGGGGRHRQLHSARLRRANHRRHRRLLCPAQHDQARRTSSARSRPNQSIVNSKS